MLYCILNRICITPRQETFLVLHTFYIVFFFYIGRPLVFPNRAIQVSPSPANEEKEKEANGNDP